MTVKQKQRQLAFLGYYPGSIDGIWGRLSAEGTRAFQTDFGLTADGIFGAQTMAKTMEVITAVQKAVTDGKIAIDGLAGEETRAAMAAWQTSHGLTGTGTADSEARSLLLADDSNNADNSDWWNDIQYFTPAEFRCKCGGRYCDGWPADVSQHPRTLWQPRHCHQRSPLHTAQPQCGRRQRQPSPDRQGHGLPH